MKCLYRIIFLVLLWPALVQGEEFDYVSKIASLADPEDRSEPGHLRLPKIVYWMEMARRDNVNITNLLDAALRRVMTNQWAGKPEVVQVPVEPPRRIPGKGLVMQQVTNEAPVRQFMQECLLRNLHHAERFGCLNTNGLEHLRRGEPPTPPREAQDGSRLVADAHVPVDICPDLAGFLANFELRVHRTTQSQTLKMGVKSRQKLFADKFLELGVLSPACYEKFMANFQRADAP